MKKNSDQFMKPTNRLQKRILGVVAHNTSPKQPDTCSVYQSRRTLARRGFDLKDINDEIAELANRGILSERDGCYSLA